MISYLNIRNFALIENSEITFSNGLNIISGETGSGKSIIIQALAILLGDRASVDQIRTGVDEAIITATISIENNKEIVRFLKESGITYENDELIIRRSLTSNGKSRSFINGSPVTTKELSFISTQLFDFHGQHDGISLLRRETHSRYLDNYIGIAQEIYELSAVYNNIQQTIKEIKSLDTDEKEKERQIELLKYEIEEIENAGFKKGEDEELKNKIKIYSNIEKISSSIGELDGEFSGETGIINRLKHSKNTLLQLSEIDAEFNQYSNDLSDIYYKVEDIYNELSRKSLQLNYNQAELDKMIEREDTLEKLKRKYGNSAEKINDYLKQAKSDLEKIFFAEESREKLNQQLKDYIETYKTKSISISKKRKEGKLKLEEKVKNELRSLSMDNVDFIIDVNTEEDHESILEIDGKKVKFFPAGIDKIEFLISPNKGEPLKSLSKIASGGELSRIILSLKSVLVKNDNIRTMIFDEIDSGIGGKVGMSVSANLKRLADEKQLICITHLPQIAAAGDLNLLICKETSGERTFTRITSLDENGKIGEIARMLSGNVSNLSIEHAKELINMFG